MKKTQNLPGPNDWERLDWQPVAYESTYVHPPCGCKVIGNGSLQYPLTIKFCERHSDPAPTLAEEILKRFPNLEDKSGTLLEDMCCPKCGNRESFSIKFTGTCEVDDESSSDDGDHEWDDNSACRCQCGYGATVKDFTFTGLDALIFDRSDEDPGEEEVR